MWKICGKKRTDMFRSALRDDLLIQLTRNWAQVLSLASMDLVVKGASRAGTTMSF